MSESGECAVCRSDRIAVHLNHSSLCAICFAALSTRAAEKSHSAPGALATTASCPLCRVTVDAALGREEFARSGMSSDWRLSVLWHIDNQGRAFAKPGTRPAGISDDDLERVLAYLQNAGLVQCRQIDLDASRYMLTKRGAAAISMFHELGERAEIIALLF